MRRWWQWGEGWGGEGEGRRWVESHLRSLSLLEESRAEFSGGLWTTHEAVLHFAFLHRHRSEYDRELVTDDDQ